jgi:hypothetical protein
VEELGTEGMDQFHNSFGSNDKSEQLRLSLEALNIRRGSPLTVKDCRRVQLRKFAFIDPIPSEPHVLLGSGSLGGN